MVEHVDYQLMLGAKKDTDFGSIVLFGMGGMRAEVYKDVSFGIPPLNQTLARLLMEETEIYKRLKGLRAKKPAELREIEQILVSFSNLIVDFPEIAEMDVNPIVISNGKALAVSARIILEEERGRARDPISPCRHYALPDPVCQPLAAPGRHERAPEADQAGRRAPGARASEHPVGGNDARAVLQR